MRHLMTGTCVLSICLFGAVSRSVAQGEFNSPIITEFLCNQTGELETEWVELYNPTSYTVDLSVYKIGDALDLRQVSDTPLYLPPSEYVILAQDANRFLQYYRDISATIISPSGWQVLNNDGGETIRLATDDNTLADSVYYESGFPDNRSWERYIDPSGISYWGGSFSSTGSTPGKANTFFHPRPMSIDLMISPDPFSPDGDGFEDVTNLRINPPEADQLELVIYDIAGRKVKTFYDAGLSIPGDIVWDGRGDDGRTLPVGIYIIYARVEGGRESADIKKTVVIAR